MPKDRISDTTQPDWHVEVSWRRQPDGDDRGSAEGHVQLATVNLRSPFEFPEKDTGERFEAGERFDGWRVTLDRAGIDRLIKSLHKAKRQAFGGECGQAPCDHAPDGGHHPMAAASTLPEILAEARVAESLTLHPEPPETWQPSTPSTTPPPYSGR